MKKILLLISVLVISSGCQKAPTEGVKYEIRNDPIWNGNAFISLGLSYQLPVHRTKDFLGTLLLYFTNPELRDNVNINIEQIDSNEVPVFYSDFKINYEAINVTVENNNNYSSSITDPKDVNYYTKTITYDEIIEEVDTKVKIYLRQDLEPTTAISYMVMTKPLNGANYEYVGHAYLNQLNIKPAAGLRKPLPDILK